MALPPLPKQLTSSGASTPQERDRRVDEWARAVDANLKAFKSAMGTSEDRLAQLEADMLELQNAPAPVADHGALTGLGDDDHTQYILAAGTRAFTGDQAMGSHKITGLADATANGDAVRYEGNISKLRKSGGSVTINSTAPTSGQVLMASGASDAAWTDPASSYLSIWMADAPPASPHSQDDEFKGSSLDAKWTEYDPSNYQTVTVGEGFCTISGTGSGSDRYGGIYQAVPAGAVDYCIVTEFSLVGKLGDTVTGGMFVAQDIATNPTTSDLYVLEGYHSTGAYAFVTRRWTQASGGSQNGIQTTNNNFPRAYARMRKTSTLVMCDVSFDGLGWTEIGSISISTLGWTPAQFGLVFNSITAVDQQIRYKFFRVFSGTGTAAMNASKIGRVVRVPV